MFSIILTIHIVLSVMLIGLVLLQQGKGADAGATFGGGGDSVFGAAGAGDFLTKTTTVLAISFMITSILLVKMYQNGSYLNSASVKKQSALEGSLINKEKTLMTEEEVKQDLREDSSKNKNKEK